MRRSCTVGEVVLVVVTMGRIVSERRSLELRPSLGLRRGRTSITTITDWLVGSLASLRCGET